MIILFNIGGFDVHLFGLTIALGVLAGFYIMLKEAERKKLNKDQLTDLAIYTVIVGIIGARLNYILAFNPSYYLQNPKEIFMINQGGLSIQGSLIAGTLFALWYMKKKNIPIWQTADAFAPAIILGQAIGRVGCDVFGILMGKEYFWGVSVGGQLLHPAQIYEAILNYGLFLILWNKRKYVKYEGQLFIIYIIGFSINRFIVEFFRSNPLVAGPISVAHMYSLAIVVVALIGMHWLKIRHQKLQSTVANHTNSPWQIDWKSTGYVGLAIITSVIIYYFIHGLS
ncbi:phosphatidylglycerol:prolipoprotein diacylglycerol transferase [Natronincola peptidivorans]|uniref:Phosphatidylglycerol--prolipoprotein diacylglyceryl transferase n=1 Tax=Natronincola peptidivorans TaxID=426128 RepID=A0A1I0BG70_9FIRM|nr:prolipoprotein diacylglyceryl transferase [Natronincola peptidivorans]SET05859.1 phosphatidylglycerol:prolipoprotein diacylglycerol transferase [Natronincola peptidivorans]